MRTIQWLALSMLLTGCATMTYTSDRSADEVSKCIAESWRKAPSSGYPLPVSVTKTDTNYFVGVELHPTFPSPVVTGTEHPFYAVWAEVSDTPSGSKTNYHRAYQFTHKIIDQVVKGCQEKDK